MNKVNKPEIIDLVSSDEDDKEEKHDDQYNVGYNNQRYHSFSLARTLDFGR